jgi:hypothetical protein
MRQKGSRVCRTAVISKASGTLLREAADAHARMGKPVAEGGSAVNPVERALRGIVRYEQRQSWLGFPFGVVKKVGDDKGGALTTLLA